MDIEIRLDYTAEDFEAYWKAFAWKKPGTPAQKQASPRMHRNVGLFFLGMGVLAWIWGTPLMGVPGVIVGLLLMYSGWYAGSPGAASRWTRKAWKQYQETGRLYTCRFTEDGVWVHDSRSDSRYDYDFLQNLWQDDQHFYLELSAKPRRSYILPKRSFTEGTPEDLPPLWLERTGKPVLEVTPERRQDGQDGISI